MCSAECHVFFFCSGMCEFLNFNSLLLSFTFLIIIFVLTVLPKLSQNQQNKPQWQSTVYAAVSTAAQGGLYKVRVM